ncbi:MAG: prephenate dehydrogenase/arogenate dehydrogenase family protein [Acidobacteria bacterium]|nr:prephenate dehydrogenase/arogenate dehydrogenase family protein [Acidobacteriota bacterium]
MRTVAIVGVGLLGGSFARALRAAGFTGRIVGVSSAGAIEAALARGVIDEGLPLEEAAPQADLIYLAREISRILAVLPEVGRLVRPGALVTDVGSTKARICREAAGRLPADCFLGAHPMAGKETRGVEAGDGDLFRGRPYILTPERAEMLEQPAVREFTGWLGRMGARVVAMSPEAHDALVARTSHLPQMVSTVLALVAGRQAGAAGASGPGLQDMTRLALSSYEIWRDILETNTEEIGAALDEFIAVLTQVRGELSTEAMEGRFREGAAFATELRRKGPEIKDNLVD